MNSRQQLTLDAIRRGVASQRPELVGFQFRIVEIAKHVVLSAPNWPDIHIGIRGGIDVQVPSYPETGKPGETALDAAIWGDRLLAKRRAPLPRVTNPPAVRSGIPVSSSQKSCSQKRNNNSEVAVRTWRFCAEYYLRELWCPQDRQLVSSFSSQTVTCEMVDDLCRKYRVNRNFEGYGIERYQPFANILNAHRAMPMTRDNVAKIVNQSLVDMRKVYGKLLTSAVTKALWMMKQHPIVIYDNYAWKGLRQCGLSPGYDDYRAYFESWFAFYDRPDTQSGLEDAISWLPNSPSAQTILRTGRMQPSELKHFVESQLLRNRVTDMRLVSEGGAEDLFG
jgi:hypothetical protein